MSESTEDKSDRWDGFFTAFREHGLPAQYPSARTPVTVDVLEIGFIFAGILILISCLIVLPGYKLCSEKLHTTIKILFCVFVTLFIFLCNFGQEWEVAHIHTKTPYRAGSRHEIQADIGVKIGLRSVNITLKGTPEYQDLSKHEKERINYNERFDWSSGSWTQGRIGFGPFASSQNREFREAQLRGAPYPILWIAEYFTIDGEGIRWGRYYRQAGFYAHILLWVAFPCWLLSLVLLQSVLYYGVVFLWLTGACHIGACVLFAMIRNPTKLTIPFEDGPLEFYWGWTFYLSVLNGFVCIILGIIIILLDYKYPGHIDAFLGTDQFQDYDEYYVSASELRQMGLRVDPGTPRSSNISRSEASSSMSVHRGLLNSRMSYRFLTPGLQPHLDSVYSDNEEDFGGTLHMYRRRQRTTSVHQIAHRFQQTLRGRRKGDRRPSSPLSDRSSYTNYTNGYANSLPGYFPTARALPRQHFAARNSTSEDVDISINRNTQHRLLEMGWTLLPVGATITARNPDIRQRRRRLHRK